jgi:hypothetical protein
LSEIIDGLNVYSIISHNSSNEVEVCSIHETESMIAANIGKIANAQHTAKNMSTEDHMELEEEKKDSDSLLTNF